MNNERTSDQNDLAQTDSTVKDIFARTRREVSKVIVGNTSARRWWCSHGKNTRIDRWFHLEKLVVRNDHHDRRGDRLIHQTVDDHADRIIRSG
ncbi:MAG: hypothetical protein CMJ33_10535 [Phycisphaerae bacterium]|nr:hypothetical protein [Phycisphaerae bacterium]